MTNPIVGIEESPCKYPFTNSPLYDELQADRVTKFSGHIKAQADFMCHESNLSRRPFILGRLEYPDLLEQCAINSKLEEYRQYVVLFLNELS